MPTTGRSGGHSAGVDGRLAGDLVVPVGRRSSIAMRAGGRRERPDSSPPAAPTSGGSSGSGVAALLVVLRAVRRACTSWLFDALYPRLTRDVTVERTAFASASRATRCSACCSSSATSCFDYARVRIVVEDRRSALGALGPAARFVRRHRGAFGAVLPERLRPSWRWCCSTRCWRPAAPAIGCADVAHPRPRPALYRRAPLLKLLFYASETSYFQRALAHASYTAAPAVVWPESPAAEAVLNADTNRAMNRRAADGSHVNGLRQRRAS